MANVVEIIIKATDQTKKGLNTPINNLNDLHTVIKQLTPAMTLLGTAAAGALVKFTWDAINLADNMVALKEKTGISVEELYKLKYVAENSDTAFEDLTVSFKKLARQMFDAANGSKEAQKNFRLMGVEYKDQKGNLLPTSEVLGEIAERFKNMKDGPDKAALAIKMFGKFGDSIIPTLNKGKDGIRALSDEAVEFGRVLDTVTAERLSNFHDNLMNIARSGQGLGNAIAIGAAPGLEYFAEVLKESAKQGGFLEDSLRFVGKTAIDTVNTIIMGFGTVKSILGTVMMEMTAIVTGNWKKIDKIDEIGIKDMKDRWDDYLIHMTAKNTKSEKQKGNEGDEILKKERDKMLKEEEEKKKAFEKREEDRRKRELKQKQREIIQERDEKIGAVSMANKSILDIMVATNSKAVGAHKAFSITQATIDAYRAITRALADIPFPFNIIQSAAIGAMAFANVRKIEGVAHGGLDYVPRDMTMLVKEGEQILTPEQRISGGGGLTQVNFKIGERILASAILDLKRKGILEAELT